ncbi:uncharacterized protein BO97DRAFT_6037 [Aspergillus homomorphus CBS 101889]|uniref:Uncharacterized protein n=1 Tax=Aspergillus homomorphus (strain CBS 101889) TaxID=1450537 RepID=A0A395IBM9_ASPHC|nr:hypothetical protein BO97DRAFT_6037 [Aspergillus homomorphus CBS 101889]RAL17395.1 hypothetical protein BO97DRAFT_6037 [Aspergillus homomorphus CBS 101889]
MHERNVLNMIYGERKKSYFKIIFNCLTVNKVYKESVLKDHLHLTGPPHVTADHLPESSNQVRPRNTAVPIEILLSKIEQTKARVSTYSACHWMILWPDPASFIKLVPDRFLHPAPDSVVPQQWPCLPLESFVSTAATKVQNARRRVAGTRRARWLDPDTRSCDNPSDTRSDATRKSYQPGPPDTSGQYSRVRIRTVSLDGGGTHHHRWERAALFWASGGVRSRCASPAPQRRLPCSDRLSC